LAKNDRIDAETIAEFGATFGKSRPARAPLLDKLAERLTWYEQITDDIVRLRTRRAMFSDPELRAQLTAELRRLVAAKRAALRAVRRLAMDDAVLRQRIELLQTMPGVGAFVALTLVIRLPELGTLSRHAVASLAGLAPWDNDSGRRRGIRHIFGGRDRVRCALYMGALTAIRINRPIVAFYDRLCAAGKPGKVALTAAMRKMLVMLNAMLRDQRAFAA
jgi:transposase